MSKKIPCKMTKESPVKSDISSVVTTLETLFVKTPAYTSSGVPMKVLQTQVALQLLKNEEKGDDAELWAKASDLINRAVDGEIAVKNANGNISLGAKKAGSSPAEKPKIATEFLVASDEDDDPGEEEEEVKSKQKQDKPYRPAGVKVTPPLPDGAASSRPRRRVPMHKGRYDSSEYVFPEYMRAYKKRTSELSGDKKPEKVEKPQRQAPKRKSVAGSPNGPQAKKSVQKSASSSSSTTSAASSPSSTSSTSVTTCSTTTTTTTLTTTATTATTTVATTSSVATQSQVVEFESVASKLNTASLSPCVICKNLGPKNTPNLNMTGCVSCTAKAHKSCVDSKSKDRFICNTCSTAKETTCSVCLDNKNQNQVQCTGCGCFYHRHCHTPPLEHKVKSGWTCFKCQILKRTADPKGGAKVVGKQQNSSSTASGGNGGKNRTTSAAIRRNSSIETARDDLPDTKDDDKSSVKPSPVKVFSESSAQTSSAEDNSNDSLRSHKNGYNGRYSSQPPLLDRPDSSIPDVSEWSTLDVYNYFQDKFTEDIALTFIEQDIDGCALKLIKKPDIVNMFRVKKFKLNVGFQVLLHVKKLQLRTKDLRLIWEDIDPIKSD